MAVKKGEKAEKEDCEEESENKVEDNSLEWTQGLEELGEMVDVFEENKLQGKTVLDVGTYGIKPLYIALKYEPSKIIGISEDLSPNSFASDIAEKSKLLTKTEIHFYTCNFFDDSELEKMLKINLTLF